MKKDSETNIKELKNIVKKFCEDRDWDQFHDAKELAIGMATESGELLQHFRFKNSKQIQEKLLNAKTRDQITEEMADVLFFLIRFAQMYNIDLATEFDKKMKKNNSKYPVDKSRGSNKKYNEN